MRKKLLAVIMWCVMVAGLAGCGQTATKDSSEVTEDTGLEENIESQEETASVETAGESVTIKMAFPTWVGYTPLYIAKEKGFFEKYNLNVELSVIEGIAERKMAFAGGQLNCLAISADSLVNLKAEGLDVQCVYMLDKSNGSDGICTVPEITNIADLKGKNVAVEQNMCEHLLLLKILEKEGMTADDINIINTNTADAGAAFVAGEVDACVVYEPYISQCVERGANKFTTAEYPVVLPDVIGFSTEFIEENPEAVANFIKAIDEADQYWEENSEESAKICEKGLGISAEDCIYTKSVLTIFDLEDNIALIGTEQEPGEFYDIFQDESDFYYSQGVISQKVAPEDIINPTFIRKLAE